MSYLKYRIIQDGNGFYRIQQSHWTDIEYKREYKNVESATEHMNDLINKRIKDENYHEIIDVIEVEE